jgi:hypothetical protein
MRRAWLTRLVAVAVGTVYAPALVCAQNQSSCLLSLTATASNATTSGRGKLMTATADSSGFCTFTLTACVNNTSVAGCSTAQINTARISGGSHLDVSGLQQLQAQLPTNQHVCSEATVQIGQTLHRRVRAQVVAADGRSAADSVTLLCQCADPGATFSSTFDGIQKVIFKNHGCNQLGCHAGSNPQMGMDLSPGVAYQNILEVPATEEPAFNRVQPGDYNRSYLWLKLALATDPSLLPSGVTVSPNGMPSGLPPLSEGELEAMRLWIFAGAPQTGTVGGTETLLNACLPPPEPITIKPLDPPARDEGVQFVMPPWKLEAHSEHELCFATYYDVSSQVPKEFQDPSGTMFRFSGTELRQDPQSHHLILNRYIGSADMIHDPSFGAGTCSGGPKAGQVCDPTDPNSCGTGTCNPGAWTCNGGPKAGQTCEPTDLTSCGTGTCTSAIQQSFACLGFGPQSNGGPTYYPIGGAQKAQDNTEFVDGVFAQIPLKGILYWNSHAFNLTDQDTMMHARLNYYFAKDQTYPVQGIFDTSKIFFPTERAAPYTTRTVCNDFQLPQGARLFSLSSHTHKHGKHFTVTAPDGTTLYESFIYNDPATKPFDPPLAFDSPDPAQRTLHYCSFYNNGVTGTCSGNSSRTCQQDSDCPSGTGPCLTSPDPTTVTRYSKLPTSAKLTIGSCTPTACVSGNVGARCHGVGDDRTCDSTPGALDGSCDACPITGGESTENEMFILIGDYYMANGGSVPGVTSPLVVTGGKPRSMSTDVAVPPQVGCGASHAGHAAGAHRHHGY